jgi:hypothetical protein
MRSKTTWWFAPIGSVRQTAGRSFDAERSSNGNGKSTTLPRVVEGLAIGAVVEIGFFAQEIAGKASLMRPAATRLRSCQCLRDFVQKRNRIAHCGSGGLVVTDGDIEQLIKFFRVFSRSLAGIVEARIADTLRG